MTDDDDYIPFEGGFLSKKPPTQERMELLREVILRQLHKSQKIPQRLYGTRILRDEAV